MRRDRREGRQKPEFTIRGEADVSFARVPTEVLLCVTVDERWKTSELDPLAKDVSFF